VLKRKEKRNVEQGAQVEAWRTKFTSASDNLEDFLFDVSLEWGFKLVSVCCFWRVVGGCETTKKKKQQSDGQQLIE
jgi:hypothetical protein